VIAEPMNDKQCLMQMTSVAVQGAKKPEIHELAGRFRSTRALARWIRTLPQRDDDGDPQDGPRVACDVTQRARLAPPDPNCVERAILYLAGAEVIDPRATRQLATIDVSDTLRHTFPLENGEPVVLDPKVRRNALCAGLWRLRNGCDASGEVDVARLDVGGLLVWLTDLAEDLAEQLAGDRGVERVVSARWALATLLGGRPITPRERADVLYALRLAGDEAGGFGPAGVDGYAVARAHVARLVARGTVGARRASRLGQLERLGYWGGKVVATYYGLGGLYDAAYAEVRRRPGGEPRAPPGEPTPVVVAATAASDVARPAEVLGALEELETKEGA